MRNITWLLVAIALPALGAAAACGRTELYRAGVGAAPTGVGGAGATGIGGAPGAGGAGGGVGGAGSGGLPACGPLIDDQEDGTGRICAGSGRVGAWYTFNDGIPSATQWPEPTPGVPIPTSEIPGGRGSSKRAMRTYGANHYSWGAGLGVDLQFDGVNYGVYDARAYDGITFWGRSATPNEPIQVRISSAPTTSVRYGGQCTNEVATIPTSCNPFSLPVRLSDEWTQYWIPFPRDGRADFELDKLTNIQFLDASHSPFDFWIDDLAFYSGPTGCCPQPPPGCGHAIVFPDPLIEGALRSMIAKPDGDLSCADLCPFVSLGIYARSPPRSLKGLQCAINLTELNISNASGVTGDIDDLGPIQGLTGLTTLSLPDNRITDLRPLIGLRALRSLDLSGNSINELSVLSQVSTITVLHLARNQIDSIGGIYSLDGLSDLTLDHNQITGGNSELVALSRFASIDLSYNKIEDLEVLRDMPLLINFNLSHNQIHDLSPLVRMPQVTYFDLSYNDVSDLSPLVARPYLGSFNLSNNRIADVTPLPFIRGLSSVSLSGNAITDIGPLAPMSQLGLVYLQDNAITDMTPLVGIARLASIYLAGNPIDCRSQIGTIRTLAARGDYLDFPVMLFGNPSAPPPDCP